MKNMWNVILYGLKENKLIESRNNPKESGRYLCTCVRKVIGSEKIERYLQVMQYNAEHKCWHDCDYNINVLSHNILAWTDEIKVCDFENFELLPGGYLIEKE